jgi:hypothetical protein
MERKLDLTISGSQLWLRARELAEGEPAWGAGNRAQGVVILESAVLLDPLADEEFGADVIMRVSERFSADKRAQRTLQLPFAVPADAPLVLGSPSEELEAGVPLPAGDYTLVYEVCVGRDVFYTLTLLAQPCAQATALKADGWGLKKGQPLQPGVF